MKKLITSLALIVATSSVGFAQLAAPVVPAAPKAPITMPAAPVVQAAPAVKAPVATTATPAKTAPVNLNTATSEQLDALPQVGPARAKAIVEARTKTKFKDWTDFEARNVIPKNAEAAIKDKVVF